MGWNQTGFDCKPSCNGQEGCARHRHVLDVLFLVIYVQPCSSVCCRCERATGQPYRNNSALFCAKQNSLISLSFVGCSEGHRPCFMICGTLADEQEPGVQGLLGRLPRKLEESCYERSSLLGAVDIFRRPF